jgi:uncharacterized RDD family membrane protein YckC
VTAYEQLTIDTPEQIALEFPLAGVGSRFLALAFDTLIQLSVGMVLAFAGFMAAIQIPRLLGAAPIATTNRGNGALWVLALVILGVFLLFYGYYIVFEIAWRGQTPGKRLVGLRVISASGRPMTALQAILRNLLRIIDQVPGLYAIGILSVLVTARNQRLGDLAAGTVVVREQPTARHQMTQEEPAARVQDRLRANRLSEQELALIERFLQRRDDLEFELRGRTALEIATRVRQRLGLTEDMRDGASTNNEDLLERVLAEYRTFGPYR